MICCVDVRCRQRDGGTSHIAPPDMNSYTKKYEFISPVTCDFVHMNSYVSDWYIKKMATDGGGGEVGEVTAMIERDIGPWFKPQNLDTFLN